MATLLIIVIFTAYIGLGIPDSLLGASWPAIYSEFGFPVSYASYITIVVSCGTVISSFMSARIINRFGTAKVTVISTFMTAAALLGFSFSQNMIWFCLFALPLGLGAGSVDTALNNYVALHYKASHVNFLHCFYGVGVSLSPYLMSIALAKAGGWRSGYRIMFFVQLAIAVLTAVTLPVWKKVKEKEAIEEDPAKILKIRDVFKTSGAKASLGIFVFSCAIESVCLIWGSTFLVNSKGMTADKAAETITFYFAGMALGRLLSGFLANRLSCIKIVMAGQAVTLAAIIMTALPVPTAITAAGLFLIGFGNGPVFPNMTHLTPLSFGKDVSQSMISMQMAFSYVSIMLTPIVCGQLVEHIGTNIIPFYLLSMFAVMAASTVSFLPTLKSKGIR